MRHKLIALTAVLFAAAAAPAQESPERPEYAGKYYLTAVYASPMTPADAKLHTVLRKNRNLAALAGSTIFNEWTDSMAVVNSTDWQTYLGPKRPVLLLQAKSKYDGTAPVVYFASGKFDTAQMVTDIRAALKAYQKHAATPVEQRGPWRPFRPANPNCPDGRCPISPQPQPTPAPQPVAPPVVTPIAPTVDVEPDLGDEPEEDAGGFPLLLLLLPLLAGGAGLYQSQKQN